MPEEAQNTPTGASDPDQFIQKIEPPKVEKPVVPKEQEKAEPNILLPQPGEKSSFADEMKKVIMQAGIRKKHVIGCGTIIIVAITVVLFFAYGGAGTVKNFFEKEKETSEMPASSVSIDAAYTAGTREFGISAEVKTAIEAGIPPVFEDFSGIDAALTTGFPELPFEEFRQYVETLEKLQSTYKTDLEAYLNASFDRVQALDAYVTTLKTNIFYAEQSRQSLGETIDHTKIIFNRVNSEKEQLEKDFFDHLGKLESMTSKEILEAFIDRARRSVELKARYSAMQKLMTFYDTALKRAKARQKDIELNYDAIIKGIKVFKVPGSGLTHIIEEK